MSDTHRAMPPGKEPTRPLTRAASPEPAVPRRPAGAERAADRPVVDGYEILGELGQGGMGVVYRAKQKSLNRLVALKVLRPERLAHGSALRRFRREAEAALRLLHPHIVHIYDAGPTGNTYYLAMEYVEGIDLGKRVHQAGPLPVDQACEYVRQAALGLQHAHERGLVHRDIKPSNLMLMSSPAGPAVNGAPARPAGIIKILDLGLARLNQPGRYKGLATTLTQEGEFIGTPDFIAPEQAKNPRKVDIRADLYSLGCSLYYLLTGRAPFPAETVPEKLYQHWFAEPVAVDRLRPEVPASLKDLLARLMAKRVLDRFQTPAALAAALEILLTTEPLPSAPAPVLGWLDVAPTARETPVAQLALDAPGGPAGSTEVVSRCEGHLDWVRAVAFSPDGRLALSGSLDHSMRLWELMSGRELGRFEKHTGAVLAVAFSPNGRYAVSGGVDQTVHVWDVDSGWELRCLTGHAELVTSVVFLPDGRHVLSASRDRTVRLWDVGGGRELGRLVGHAGDVNTVAVSADGRLAVSGGADRTLRVWDLATGRELRCLRSRQARDQGPVVTAAALAPDSQHVLAAGSDHALVLWDLEAGREVRRYAGHTDWVTSVALSPDGRRAVSGGQDRTLRLWEVATGQELRCFREHANWVTSVAFSPDGRRALSGSGDRTICLWELPEE
jgi:WD40 repeat protein/serine/threonine protein kinase